MKQTIKKTNIKRLVKTLQGYKAILTNDFICYVETFTDLKKVLK